jgi:hypothetical protein
MVDRDEFAEEIWTPDEQARLASLPLERVAPDELKARTMDALRARGLLGLRSGKRPGRILAVLAAASLIFAAGALVGYAAARRSTPPATETRATTSQDVARASGPTTVSPKRHVIWY